MGGLQRLPATFSSMILFILLKSNEIHSLSLLLGAKVCPSKDVPPPKGTIPIRYL